jgi:chromate reductase, NAD(P)H dehydrogenase (quinone)
VAAVKVLAFSGSMRTDSLNKKLVRVAAAAVERAGAEVTHLDLRDLALPLYDGDLEARSGLPEGARRLKQLMDSHDAFLISSPEYNSSISGVLKNAIDWASRPVPGEPALAPFTGKIVGLMAASPGGFGGIRALGTLRAILENLGSIVVPKQLALPHAHEAFTQAGELKHPKIQASVEALANQLVEIASKLKK